MVWVTAHYVMAMSLASGGASCVSLVIFLNLPEGGSAAPGGTGLGEPAPHQWTVGDLRVTQWMLGTSLFWSLVCSILIQVSLRGAGSGVRRWRKRTRLGLRCALASLAVAVPYFTTVLGASAADVLFDHGGQRIGTLLFIWSMVALMLVILCLEAYGRMRRKRRAAPRAPSGSLRSSIATALGRDARARPSRQQALSMPIMLTG